MKYLGIDYGEKRIGLAVSTQGIAFPHSVVPNDSNVFPMLADVIKQQRVEGIVIGDTRSISGHENPVTKKMEEFAGRVMQEFGLPVELAPEADSSVAVSEEGEEKRDEAAAAFILQRFLDMKGANHG
jgi:putative transcription antitermination factor YqgF